MIDYDGLEDGAWYDGFLWYDARQKGVTTLQWRVDDALFTSDSDARVYPHVAEPRLPKVWTFEPNTKGVDPNGQNPNDRAPTGEAA